MCEPSVNSINQEVKPAESLAHLLLFHLNAKSALQRIAVALVISEWATLRKVWSLSELLIIFNCFNFCVCA